jgi:hypothetical protein
MYAARTPRWILYISIYHAFPVRSRKPHPFGDDPACSSLRVSIGVTMAYCRNLFQSGDGDLLADRAAWCVKQLDDALESLERLARMMYQAEAALTLASDAEPRPEPRGRPPMPKAPSASC